MALHGVCYKCLKYLVLIFNFLFWLLGLTVLVVALWLYIDTSTYIQVSAKSEDFNKGLFVFIGVGILMLVVGFLGCCGALKESQCMLTSFFVFLMIILVAEVTVVVLAFQNREGLTSVVRESMKTIVQKEYTGNRLEARTNIMDEIQSQLDCCGADDYKDWRNSAINGNSNSLNFGPFSGGANLLSGFRVPPSCCRRGISEKDCEDATKIDPGTSLLDTVSGNSVPRNIYNEGCSDKLIALFEAHSEYFIGVGLFVAVIELMGMVVSMILCCAIRRLDDMKV